MNEWHAVVLGVVEGITEFLPVSSTGHLIVTSKLLGLSPTALMKSFQIFIQLGAILAVVGVYFKTLINRRLWWPIICGFIPTAIVGASIYPTIKDIFLEGAHTIILSLALGGLVIIAIEFWQRGREESSLINEVSPKQALVIGVVQALAVIPGVSRAAAAIIGGRVLGLSRRAAVEFSFLLAVPTILAATVFDLVKSNLTFSSNDYRLFALGFLVAFLTALLAVKSFLKFIQTRTLLPFGLYRIIIALLFVIMWLK